MQADGAILARMIGAGEVQAGHIAAGAIDAGNIIVDDIIVTDHLVADAATSLNSATAGTTSHNANISGGFTVTLVSLSIDVAVGTVLLGGQFTLGTSGNTIDGTVALAVSLEVGGSPVKTVNWVTSVSSISGGIPISIWLGSPFIATQQSLSVGTHTISLIVSHPAVPTTPGGTGADITVSMSSPLIWAFESRR
jgi:hypothetical protein